MGRNQRRVVLIFGDPGNGKSHLARWLRDKRVSIHDFGVPETTTDPDGRFRLRAVPHTANFVIVDAPDYEIAYKDVAAGTSEVTVTLSAE